MKEDKIGNWQVRDSGDGHAASLRAVSITPNESFNSLDFLVESKDSSPRKLRFAFVLGSSITPLGWIINFELKFGKTNPATMKVETGPSRDGLTWHVGKGISRSIRKEVLKSDYMEASWKQWENGKETPVTAKFNLVGRKEAIKSIISKSRRVYISDQILSLLMKFGKSKAEKCIKKFEKKFKHKETHDGRGVMADELREIVISQGGLKGTWYWELPDTSCIRCNKGSKRPYIGISPLWYDHKARPYGTGERSPNIKGLNFYIPRDQKHLKAVAEAAMEELRKSEALRKELEERLQKEIANLKREFGKLKNAKLFKWISWFLAIWRIITVIQEILSILELIREHAKIAERLEKLIEFIEELL